MDDQYDMLDDEAHARRDDPDTSKAAAASLTVEKLRASQKAVYEAFEVWGKMHDALLLDSYERHRQAYDWPLQSHSGIRSRRSELVRGGLLKDTGERATLESGRKSAVWGVA